jgi:sulfite reductase beta subunit-like hemoprotein
MRAAQQLGALGKLQSEVITEPSVTLNPTVQANWDDLDIDDVDVRLKWAGLFHRKKRTPGKFMMRLKVCWAQGLGSS